jgi:hypothetical protein
VRGDLGGTGKTIDWMKLERLVVLGLVAGAAAGDPESMQDMQGAKGKDRRGQRWSIAVVLWLLVLVVLV